jgi:hypothetical protein
MPSTQATKPRSSKKAPGKQAPPVAERQEPAPPAPAALESAATESAPAVAERQEPAPQEPAAPESAPAVAEAETSAPREPAMSDTEMREGLVRVAAYSYYERRGCVPGNELDDWLQAEMEVSLQWAAAQEPPETK